MMQFIIILLLLAWLMLVSKWRDAAITGRRYNRERLKYATKCHYDLLFDINTKVPEHIILTKSVD